MKGKHVPGNQQANHKTFAQPQNARPTIGLLGMMVEFPNRASAVTKRWDANQLGFACGKLRSLYGFEAQANVLVDLVGAENVDGLVIWSDWLGQFIDAKEMQAFCEQFHPLPVVSVGQVQGFPSVLADNYQGAYELVTHLVESHRHSRIACIRGPKGNAEAEQRYRGYVNALTDHGLNLDPDLVVEGGLTGPSGLAALRVLLDERGIDFDALVTPTDKVAIAVIQALKARGLRVPGDVAVVGYDNDPAGAEFMPPLTSVQTQWVEAGARAVETVLALLAGEKSPKEMVLPSRAVIRQSCGCHSSAVAQTAAGTLPATSESFETVFPQRRKELVAAITQAMHNSITNPDPIWAEQLLDAFAVDLSRLTESDFAASNNSPTMPGALISTLNNILHQMVVTGNDVIAWQQVISELRRHTLPYLANTRQLLPAGDIWQQAQVLISETIQRSQSHQIQQTLRQDQKLRQISQTLITSFGLKGLMEALVQVLPQMGIPTCYLNLYADPRAPSEGARLIFAYDQGKRIELDEGGEHFPSRQLIPGGMLPQDQRYEFMIEPLYFREEQMGFVVFGPGAPDDASYGALREQISSALRGALLMQQMTQRSLQLQTVAEVSQAASSILELDDLIQQTVDLAHQRFNLYYAGLFLVDEKEEWAMLHAGTGQAGQEMLKRGHRLKIGGTSMIGSCVARRQARIALDVGEEAIRFDNPLLPLTRSELALPLISRGRAIGALTIQSTQEATFSQTDITVLQTMADQLANAIDNARLLEQTRAALAEVKATHRRYLEQGGGAYLRTTGATHYEVGQPDTSSSSDETLDPIRQVMEQQRTVILSSNGEKDRSVLVTPITVRGEVVGALGIHDEDGERQWNDDEIVLIEAIAERMALAAENLWLFDNTQHRAARERLIGDIAGQMQRATDMKSLMRITAEELNRALESSHVYEHLNPGLSDEQTATREGPNER